MTQTKYNGARASSAISKALYSGGFSLIELMIAIFVTLFLVAGMIAIVISMKGSFNTQDRTAQVQESALFALTTLDAIVRQAGYFPRPKTNNRTSAFPTVSSNADGSSFSTGAFIVGVGGGASSSDSVTVRFQSDSGDGLLNCIGGSNTTGAAVTYANTFYILNNQLNCSVSADGILVASEVLVDNVASMKIKYGVDSSSTGSADRYVTAAEIGTATYPYAGAMSLEISLQMIDLVSSTPSTTVIAPKMLVHTINLMNKL